MPARSFLDAGSLVAAAASWGIATALSKQALSHIHPILLLTVQLAVSVGFLWLVLGIQRTRVSWSSGLVRIGALGILNPGLSYTLSLLGLATITASLSTLLWAVEPVLILVLARVVLGERLTPLRMVLSVAAVAGVVWLAGGGARGESLLGVLITLGGVGCCAVYTVLTKRSMLAHGLTSLSVVATQQVFALACALPILALVSPRSWLESLGRMDIDVWLLAAAAGLLYYAIAFWFYLAGLRHYPVAVAGPFLNLIPVFGVAASYLLLGERLAGRQWSGALVIMASVVALTTAGKIDR